MHVCEIRTKCANVKDRLFSRSTLAALNVTWLSADDIHYWHNSLVLHSTVDCWFLPVLHARIGTKTRCTVFFFCCSFLTVPCSRTSKLWAFNHTLCCRQCTVYWCEWSVRRSYSEDSYSHWMTKDAVQWVVIQPEQWLPRIKRPTAVLRSFGGSEQRLTRVTRHIMSLSRQLTHRFTWKMTHRFLHLSHLLIHCSHHL